MPLYKSIFVTDYYEVSMSYKLLVSVVSIKAIPKLTLITTLASP